MRLRRFFMSDPTRGERYRPPPPNTHRVDDGYSESSRPSPDGRQWPVVQQAERRDFGSGCCRFESCPASTPARPLALRRQHRPTMPVAMKQQTHKELRVVSGRSSQAFAGRVCSELRRDPGYDQHRELRQRRDPCPLRRVDQGLRRLHRRHARRVGGRLHQRCHRRAPHHGRRGQACLRQAHHRGGPPSTGTPDRTARPPGASPSQRGCWPTCSWPRGPSGCCRSICTPARSRASSTARSTT